MACFLRMLTGAGVGGEAVDGVRCSVGVYQGHGELEKIRFAITALNESRTESVSLVDAYRPILTNDQGKAVPYRIDHSERDKRIIGGNGLLQTGRNFRLTSTGSVMSCNTGHGSIVRFDENLSDWYQNLSPGIYQFRIEMPYQDPGNFDLISPTVKIEITAAGDGIKSPDR